MSSNSAFGAPGQPNYAPPKRPSSLTLTCASSLARYNVTANAILPSGATRMIDSIPRAVEAVAHTANSPANSRRARNGIRTTSLRLLRFWRATRRTRSGAFGSFGYNVALMSQPKVIRAIRADHRWAVADLAEAVPRAFGDLFEGRLTAPAFHP
jgi:NAD(P)-dependent dehydrogenase (short-subunit alcohol dehydrogenase family)